MDFSLKVNPRDMNLIAMGLNTVHGSITDLVNNLQAQVTAQELAAQPPDAVKLEVAVAPVAPKQRKKRGPNKPKIKANGAAHGKTVSVTAEGASIA